MNIKNDLKKGVIYNSIGKYSNVVISLLVQFVLARLLTPEDFGVVSIINVFLVFFQLLSDFGIGPAIIQRKDLEKDEINHIFSFSVYFSFFFTVLFALLSKPISIFYQNDLLTNAVPLMSVALLFNSLMMVPQNILLKEKKFKAVNLTQIFGSLANGMVSILFAFLGYSFYAIIFGNIARAILQFIVYYLNTKVSFHFKFAFNPLKKIYTFSRNQLFFNIINYFSRNLDNILIGRYMPTDQLGYYDKAYQLTLYPNSVFAGVISSAVQPVFSSYQNQVVEIKKGYLGIAKILANFGIPLSVFLFFSSEEIILFFYGQQWSQSILVFQILSVTIWIQMLQSSTGGFFQSANRTDLLLLSGILSTIVNIIGITVGVYLGSIYWVAVMIAVTFSLNFFQTNYLLLCIAFKSSVIEFYSVLGKPILIGIIEIIAFMALPELEFGYFFNLIIKGIIFASVLFLGLIITKQGRDILKFIK